MRPGRVLDCLRGCCGSERLKPLFGKASRADWAPRAGGSQLDSGNLFWAAWAANQVAKANLTDSDIRCVIEVINYLVGVLLNRKPS